MTITGTMKSNCFEGEYDDGKVCFTFNAWLLADELNTEDIQIDIIGKVYDRNENEVEFDVSDRDFRQAVCNAYNDAFIEERRNVY